MLHLLWLIPVIPFAGFLFLTVFGRRVPEAMAALIGTGSVAASALITALVAADFLSSPPPDFAYVQTISTWFAVDGLAPTLGLHLDMLSLVMVVVVTFVGFLIHLYSVSFMKGDDGYRRFFAYMNLFVGSMLVLVLADNLLLLYLGWEGVGLCSYLLIGFWYRERANGIAAVKAFVVTRIGDTAFAVGLFLLFVHLGTLDIQGLTQKAAQSWPAGSFLPSLAAALLLAGAVGKSAQLPLQTWLPDAMAGPTPVSALIHAATMVTAGVYLIARMHGLFILAPDIQFTVALIGATTLLIAAASALTQVDIKRVLAYSTMSQVGYMFLALGVGAWSTALFHFMTHAFFKALLFLSAGVVIEAMGGEHDIFKMGGLKRRLPLAFWAFLIGAASLSALPLVTAGYYSKDLIIFQALASAKGGPWLWAAGLVGAILTSLYAFRVVFVVFFGRAQGEVRRSSSVAIAIPLVVLSVLAVVSGFIELPELKDRPGIFLDSMRTALPGVQSLRIPASMRLTLEAATAAASIAGIILAVVLYVSAPQVPGRLERFSLFSMLRAWWFSGWGFDRLYRVLFVTPFVALARINRGDVVDLFYRAVARVTEGGYQVLTLTQSGKVRWYAAGIAFGAVAFIGIAVFSWR